MSRRRDTYNGIPVCKRCGGLLGDTDVDCVPDEHWRAKLDRVLAVFSGGHNGDPAPTKPDLLARDDWHRKSQALVGGLLHRRGWLL